MLWRMPEHQRLRLPGLLESQGAEVRVARNDQHANAVDAAQRLDFQSN